jgi:tetratricopeptide (TPR) repeat protein
MAVIYDCLHEYDKALEEYNFAKSLTRNFIPDGHQKDHFCLVPLYSNIGLTYQQLNLSGHAFTHAFRAIGISPNKQDDPILKNEILASSHFNLGLILDLQKKFSEALIHYEQALKYRQDYLPPNHPDVISLHHTITSLTSDEMIL